MMILVRLTLESSESHCYDSQIDGTSLLAMYRFLIMNLFYLGKLSSSTGRGWESHTIRTKLVGGRQKPRSGDPSESTGDSYQLSVTSYQLPVFSYQVPCWYCSLFTVHCLLLTIPNP